MRSRARASRAHACTPVAAVQKRLCRVLLLAVIKVLEVVAPAAFSSSFQNPALPQELVFNSLEFKHQEITAGLRVFALLMSKWTKIFRCNPLISGAGLMLRSEH